MTTPEMQRIKEKRKFKARKSAKDSRVERELQRAAIGNKKLDEWK